MSQSKSKLARALETIADLRRQLKQQAGTPSSTWAANGEPDPHGDRYNCERAELALGDLTDDQLANGAFMNYDRPLDISAILSKQPDYHSPIAWMMAVKDRIRWLSRSLTAKSAERDALLAERDALKKDAERYRWLRDMSLYVGVEAPAVAMADAFASNIQGDLLAGERLDSAIDAALQGEQP